MVSALSRKGIRRSKSVMSSEKLGPVDSGVGLAYNVDEFEQILQVVPLVDTEERLNIISAYNNTSQTSLESFIQSLSKQIGVRKEGILRLAGLFSLLQPWSARSEVSSSKAIPSILFGVLKTTLIIGHDLCGDSKIIVAKLDHMSQRTSAIKGDELSTAPADVIQDLLTQLASVIVGCCNEMLNLRSRAEFQKYESAVSSIDQICWNLEREIEKARKLGWDKERADEQKRAAEKEKIEKVQAWIQDMTEGDLQDKHDSIASSHVTGTGAAFVFKVQEWLKAKEVPIFLAHGPPGVGKTYLACAVISQHLQEALEGIDGMAYAYFTYDDRDRQTPFVIYASIVAQLLRDSPPLKEEIFRLFDDHQKVARRQKWQLLQRLKRAVASLKSSKLLVFDALDEASEQMRDDILDLLESARSDSPRVFVTSRSDYRQSLPCEQVLSHRVQADADDIRAFCEDRLRSRNVRRIVKAQFGNGAEAQQFASKLSEEILTSSHGLFLHAYYAAKDVCEQVNIAGIRTAASKQHKDANVIYNVTLEQINGLGLIKKELAHRTIAWLTFTKKPFEENELREAFAVDSQTGQIDFTTQFDIENVIEYCRGLVVRVKTNKKSYLRLAHMTAQEYFSQIKVFQTYHADMCMTCFNRLIGCLPKCQVSNYTKNISSPTSDRNREECSDLDDTTDEEASDLAGDEASQRPLPLNIEEGHNTNLSGTRSAGDDGEDEADDEEFNESLFEDFDSQSIFEDNDSWRYGGEVWPISLLPWVAVRTPFSVYAASHALSHLKDSTVSTDIEKIIFTFIKSAISRRRRSTFSNELHDHPYRMTMLHMATFIGIASVVGEVIEMPTVHVDDKDVLGRTALMWALGLGQETVAERLLEAGAQIQEHDRRQRSTLLYASAVKNEALLTKILDRMPEQDIDARFLSSCAESNNTFLLDRALMCAKINVNVVGENGKTPFHEAIISGSEAAVQLLIKHGAQLSVPDRDGRTPLMYAVSGLNINIVNRLIRAGAVPDPPIANGTSPLHIATKSAKGCLKMLKLLLQAHAEISVEDEDGLVPLQSLLRTCRDQYRPEKEVLACVKLLSADTSTISHQSHDGENALHDAVRCPYILVLRYLVSQAPRNTINCPKDSGQTPIFEALTAYNVPAFNVLIDLPNIDLLATRSDKKTLLNCAAWANEITVAKKLIDKEQRLIYLAEQHSVSAIHYAVERDNPAMFKLLLEAGSTPRSRRHRFNEDLISYAAFEGREWCLKTLLNLEAWMAYDQSGQLIAHKDDLNRTLLHRTAASGSTAVLRTVLDSLPLKGLSLEDRDTLGQTPLHYAARTRNEMFVTQMLKAGSDKDALNTAGETPLDLALDSEASSVVRTLALADAHVGQGTLLRPSKLHIYKNEDFFARLNHIMETPVAQREDFLVEVKRYKEKTVHRIGNEDDIFDQWSPDVPFLEIVVPQDAALPINQVVFETISHDQGFSHEAHQWGGTYEHSHTYFEVAARMFQTDIHDAEQKDTPRIRVQTNLHADFNFHTHVNTFDCIGPNQERRQWVDGLRPGSRIQLYATAMYPGWQNYVQKAAITIRYQEVTEGKVTEDDAIENLPGRIQKLNTCAPESMGSGFPQRPKVVIYHQTLHAESGVLISLRPLVRENTGVTAVILGIFHVYMHHKETVSVAGDQINESIRLNEYAIDDPGIEEIWVDVKYLRREGVKVLGMLSMRQLGCVADDDKIRLGSHEDLTFERYYGALHDLVVSTGLDGIDLDIDGLERHVKREEMIVSLQGVIRLIDRLHDDFGSNFIITITASAKILLGADLNQPINSIDYQALELQRGHLINWYNVQIFSGRHDDDETGATRNSASIFVRELDWYIHLMRQGVFQAHKILWAISTSPSASNENDDMRGAHVDLYLLHSLLQLLRWSHGPLEFGGVAGWEYSQTSPSNNARAKGGKDLPWIWVQRTQAILEDVWPGAE